MPCVSASPVSRACALAMAAFDVAFHAFRSFINSIERFKTFCLLCRNSSDWCAKEKECKDSEGKRERSSVKAGEDGPDEIGMICE